MNVRIINAEHAPKPASAYSQAIEISGANRMLFISGQPGIDKHGTTPVSFDEQAKLAWQNLKYQLEDAGMTVKNLVKVTMYFADPADIPASRLPRTEALGDWCPASTVLIAGLASSKWKIEIEAIACD